jgi:tetratricopeptide (TPR) repeat protein
MMFDEQPSRWLMPMYWLRRTVRAIGERAARVGALLVWPLEWLIGLLGHKLFAATEGAKHVESALLYLVYWLTWPLRMLYRMLRAAARFLIPEPVRRAIVMAFHFVSVTIHRGLVWIGDTLMFDVAILWLTWLLRPVWYPFAAVGNFFVAWAATRPAKKLLWGIPALALILPIVVAAAYGYFGGQRDIAARYRLAVKKSLDEKDYKKANLFERKLAQLGVDTKLSEYLTAQALERDGRMLDAYDRMQRLAPLDAPGYPQAHFWIIQRLMSDKIELPEGEVHRLVGAHLDSLESMSAKDPQLNVIRAVWLSQENKLDEAAVLLEPLVHRIPSAAIEHFRINLTLRRFEEARRDATAIRDHMQRQIRNGTSLKSTDYQFWATAEELLGSSLHFRDVLLDWIKNDPQNELARRSLAAHYLREFDLIIRSPNPDSKELVACVREAFEVDNVPDDVRQRIALLYQQQHLDPAVSKFFDELTKSRNLPPALAETVGTAAAVRGQWKRAQACLEQAVARNEQNHVAWNNLACVMLQQPTAPLDTARAAVEKALALDPDNYRYRETRGQILLKLGQTKPAVDDLEFALNAMPGTPAIHKSLSVAYAALGDQTLAAFHRQHSE